MIMFYRLGFFFSSLFGMPYGEKKKELAYRKGWKKERRKKGIASGD